MKTTQHFLHKQNRNKAESTTDKEGQSGMNVCKIQFNTASQSIACFFFCLFYSVPVDQLFFSKLVLCGFYSQLYSIILQV
jgi:hypothetical protein